MGESWIPSPPPRRSSGRFEGLDTVVPQRIVSLVPSLTEALFAFGVGTRVVGRTRYCLWPPAAVGKVPVVGGTKKVDVGRLLELEPDMVVAVKEENSRENVEKIQAAGVPVFVGAPQSVEGAIWLLRELARAVEAPRSDAVLSPIERVYGKLRERTKRTNSQRLFVPIWKNPYMSVGSDTYAHDVLETCGGENVCGGSTRYPVFTLEQVEAAQPDIVLLPDEPYPFCAEDLEDFYALDMPAAHSDRIHLVDGKLLTWYGPRMASSLTQLAALLRS
jgi:ABC-type Fe3+-hydroxamate transport system substrate-binding protein